MKKEITNYLIFGILTTILNIVLFYLLKKIIDYKIANLITLLVVKIVAYLCNKKYVFKSKCENKKELFKETIRFAITRFLTFLIDYFGLILLVEIVKFSKMFSKVLILGIVIILNYIFGKLIVFKNNNEMNLK